MKKLLSALCTGIFGFPLGGSCRGTRLMRGRAKERGAFASPVCKGKNANKQTPLGERLPLIPRLRRYLPPGGKALAALCACLALAALASCGAKAPSAPRFSDGNLTVTAEVTRGDLAYAAEFSRRDGARTLTFLAPETLAGLTVTDAGGVCRLALGELSVESPDAAAFFTPFTLFDLPEGSLTGSREENGLTVYEGTRGEERFRVAVDAAGRPVRLEGNVGGEEIGVTVTKFEFDTPSEGTERERESE